MPLRSIQPMPPLKSRRRSASAGRARSTPPSRPCRRSHRRRASAIAFSVVDLAGEVRVEHDPARARPWRAGRSALARFAVVVLAPGEDTQPSATSTTTTTSPPTREPAPERGRAAPERRLEAACALVRRRPAARAHGALSAQSAAPRGGGRSAALASCTIDTTCERPMMSNTRLASGLGAASDGRPALRLDPPHCLDERVDPAGVDEREPGEVEDDVRRQKGRELPDAAPQAVGRQDVGLAREREQDHPGRRLRGLDRQPFRPLVVHRHELPRNHGRKTRAAGELVRCFAAEPEGRRAVPTRRDEEDAMPTTMSDPRELFLRELQDIYYAEQTITKALPKMAKEATDPELAAGFQKHLDETKGHVETLKHVFEPLGENAKAEQCPAIDGIKEEHDEFISEEKPAPKVSDIFLTGSGARAEHYEIAAYTGLITIARGLGETECAKLLAKNLKQEKAALDALTTVGKRLAEGREGARERLSGGRGGVLSVTDEPTSAGRLEPERQPEALHVSRRPRWSGSSTRRRSSGSAALAIPPAWTRVWISPNAGAKLQATGLRRRRPQASTFTTRRFRAAGASRSSSASYGFGEALPALRKQSRAPTLADDPLEVRVDVGARDPRSSTAGGFEAGSERAARNRREPRDHDPDEAPRRGPGAAAALPLPRQAPRSCTGRRSSTRSSPAATRRAPSRSPAVRACFAYRRDDGPAPADGAAPERVSPASLASTRSTASRTSAPGAARLTAAIALAEHGPPGSADDERKALASAFRAVATELGEHSGGRTWLVRQPRRRRAVPRGRRPGDGAAEARAGALSRHGEAQSGGSFVARTARRPLTPTNAQASHQTSMATRMTIAATAHRGRARCPRILYGVSPSPTRRLLAPQTLAFAHRAARGDDRDLLVRDLRFAPCGASFCSASRPPIRATPGETREAPLRPRHLLCRS